MDAAGMQSLFMVIIFVAIFYFMIIMPQKKRDKKIKEMLAALKVGDDIVTVGGVIGKVVNIKDEQITIETGSDKVKIKFERTAIKVVTSESN